MLLSRRVAGSILTAATFALVCAACSAAGDSSGGSGATGNAGSAAGGSGGSAAGGSGASAAGGTGAGQSSGGLSGLDAGGGGGGDASNVCAGDFVEAHPTPLNVLILLDQSSSMASNSRWQKVTSAIRNFTQASDSAGIRVALTYFAKTRACQSNSDCQHFLGKCGGDGFCTFDDLCTAADYETPEIDFSELPAAASSIATSLSGHSPLYNTPTPPALEGALNHARGYATAHPDEAVVVVLATDGLPDSLPCNIDNKSLPEVVNIAQAGLQASPSIPTYVIGVGNQLTQLNAVAQAGGTGSAYLVDQGAQAEQQFLDAMNKIRGDAALPCEYLIPESTTGAPLDYHKVNVVHTPDGAAANTLLGVTDQSACAGGGWYYDDPSAPTRIQICPSSCQQLSAGGGSVEIQLGCETRIK